MRCASILRSDGFANIREDAGRAPAEPEESAFPSSIPCFHPLSKSNRLSRTVAEYKTFATMKPGDVKPTIAVGSDAVVDAVPKVRRHINAVGIDGVDYRLPPGLLDEAFARDLTNMEGAEMVKKYSLVPWGAIDGSDQSHKKLGDSQEQQQQ